MDLKTRELSVTDEKRIVTGLVVSTNFIREVEHDLVFDYFTNDHLKRIAEWAMEFYEKYKKAPSIHIQDIYDTKKKKLKEAERELISKVLSDLSQRYDAEDDVNVDYLVQNTERYFRKRELEITSSNIAILNDEGKLEEAEAEIAKYNRVSLSLDKNIYLNPGDPEVRERIYKKREEKEVNFFRFPGDLGKFCGNMKKGDVVGVTAPQKRGKSFLLTNAFNQAIMSKIRTVFFSIEMTDTEMLTRVDKSFVPTVASDLEPGDYTYPVFDCKHNQIGDCSDRKSKKIVLDENGIVTEHPKHKVCTKCRDHKDKDERARFEVTVYRQPIHRDNNSIFTMRQQMKKFNGMLNKYARLVVRPKYSLTYDLMLYDLQILETRHGFIPEMIILDYADILKLKSRHEDYKLEEERWMLLQEVAGITQSLVFTATQGNKDSHTAERIHTTQQAGFYGKGKHVNLMLGINQKAEEKRNGIWRMGKLDARDTYFDQEDTCMVLQDFKTGQMHLDSYWKEKYFHRN